MTAGTKASRSQKDFWAQHTKLWQQPTSVWEEFLHSPGIGVDKVLVTGTQVKLCCPYHKDNNPSGHINTTKGYYKCFAESCRKGVKDPIRLVQRLMNVSYTEAFEAFRRHFKLTRSIRSAEIKAFDEEATLRKRMALISEVCWRYLCNVWTATTAPGSAQATKHWLKDVRGITDVMAMSAIGMLPRKNDLERLCIERNATTEDIQWIMRFLNDYLGTGYMDCVVYTYSTAPDHITAFKLRKPEADKDSVRVIKLHEDDAMGCFGLTHSAYAPLIWSDVVDNVIIVEGEHDQLAAYQGQCKTAVFDEIFIALGGGGHQGLDFLAGIGLPKASIVGDHDDGGEDYPINILKKTQRVSCRVFDWPIKLTNPTGGKWDPDECIKFHGFSLFYDAVVKDRNYAYAARWCHHRAVQELHDVNEDDVVEQEDVVTEIASLLRNDAELRSFTSMITKEFPLLTPARIRLAASKHDETPVGFVQSIVEWVKEHFHVISVDNSNNVLRLWHKASRQEVDIAMGLRKGVVTFKSFTPTGVLYEWVRDEIGLPASLPDPEAIDATHAALEKCDKDISSALEMAFSALASQTKSAPWLLKGQGCHLSEVSDGGPGYIVNGNRVYKITWNTEGTQFKEVTELDGPSDGDSVFSIQPNAAICPEGMSQGWLPLIDDAKDFLTRPKYSMSECVELLHRIYSLACVFKHQAVDVKYMVYMAFYSYLSDCMQKRVMTHICGEHESGKSTTLSMCAGHRQMPEYALTYHAATSDNSTSAAVFQHFNGSRVLLALDEANDPDDGSPEAQRMKQLYRRMRGLPTKGMADYSVGTTDGTGNRYFIHNPIITASATVIVDSMDESRFNTLHLLKSVNKGNTRAQLSQTFGHQLFQDLRESIFLNALRIAPLVAQTYQRAYLNYGKNDKRALQRKHENLMPLVAIAKALGQDGDAFIDEFTASRASLVRDRLAASPGNELVDAILNSPQVQIGTDDIPTKKTLRSILQHPEYREQINTSDTGIYFDEVSGSVGVIWPQVRQTLLVGSLSRYGRMSVTSLRAKASESQHHIRQDLAHKAGTLMRLRAAGMVGSPITSIFDVRHILQEAADARQEFLLIQKEMQKAKAVAAALDGGGSTGGDPDNPLDGIDLE